MIITKFYGGLGNQLFQFAFARSLANRYDLPLRADVTFFDADPHRRFILDKIGIDIEFADRKEVIDLHHRISKKTNFFSKRRYHLLQESEQSYFRFDFKYYRLGYPKGLYTDGYWQHPDYIPADFNLVETFNSSLSAPEYRRVLSEIQSTESVAIHVRRGDYVNDKHTNQVHGTCSYEYYQRAVEWLNSSLDNLHFFIFSDDIDWCKASFIGSEYEFVSCPDKGEWIDFGLMMNCRHQVIANSSFSWWAAWLNENPNKKIVAPRKWFNNGSWDTSGLIPEDWLRL